MKIYIFEDTVYKLTDKQFEEVKKQEKLVNEDFKKDIDFFEFLESKKSDYKIVGMVDGHFQL